MGECDHPLTHLNIKMNASKTSKVITWITIVWVILVSQPKLLDAGPLAFTACMSQTAPMCASMAATATATCAASAWLPPLFCACMASLMGVVCGGAVGVCVPAFLAPTP